MVELTQRWWLVILRGVAAILFGVLALAWPGVTLLALAVLFGIYALIDGVTAMALAVTEHSVDRPRRWFHGLLGAAGILAGVIAIAWPGLTALVLLFIIAFWALVVGVLQVITAVRLRRELRHEWFLLASGVLDILLGILLLVRPAAGALALLAIIAVFAMLWGISLVLFGLRLHHLDRQLHAAA